MLPGKFLHNLQFHLWKLMKNNLFFSFAEKTGLNNSVTDLVKLWSF